MIGIISVTKKGDKIADTIERNFGGQVFKKSTNDSFKLDHITKLAFENYKYIIFVSSSGIAVRAIAKYLKGKDIDPGIVVVDVCNNFTISLVSGHLGGANLLAKKVAGVLENTPVITTATDNLGVEAPDIIALNNNLIIDNLKVAKNIASRIVNGEEVYFKDDSELINCPQGYIKVKEVKENTVWVTNKEKKETDNVLKLIRKNVVLGIGCKRNTDSCNLKNFVMAALIENNIDTRAVKIISSINIKNDEKAILDLVQDLNCQLKFFSKEEIKTVHNKYEGSDFVEKTIGVRAVSEPVVELLGAKLYKQKLKKDGMTLSIGFLN